MKTCRKGHEMTPENTKVDSRGYPRCRECIRANRQVQAAQFKGVRPGYGPKGKARKDKTDAKHAGSTP